MANIILRDAGSISSPGSTAKGSPLTNLEVDNNFSNINVTLGILTNLTTTAQGNLVVAINELVASNATQNTRITLVTTNLATTNSNITTFHELLIKFMKKSIVYNHDKVFASVMCLHLL